MSTYSLQAEQVIAIAEKITTMEVLRENHIGLGIHENNGVFFDQKNRNHYFSIRYDRNNKRAVVVIYKQTKIQASLIIKVVFLTIGGFEIASRLVVTNKGEVTNYITLPHFVTLKESVKKVLLNK